MKTVLTICLNCVLVICVSVHVAQAAEKRGKFGIDKRHDTARRMMLSFIFVIAFVWHLPVVWTFNRFQQTN